MYLSKFQNVVVPTSKCIRPNHQVYLPKLLNVFVLIAKCIELPIKNTISFNQFPPVSAATNLFAIANRLHNSCLANVGTACIHFSLLGGRVIQQTPNYSFSLQ